MSKVLYNDLYSKVAIGLKKRENEIKLKRAIGEFLDRNNNKITTAGPIHQIIFSENEFNALYNAVELTPEEILASLKKSPEVDDSWKIMNNPFNTAIVLAIHHYTVNYNKDMLEALLVYFTMSMYPTLHHKYFEFEPNENIMNYTINNLSNKYKIKQLGTMYLAMVETTSVCYETNKPKIKACTDKEIIYFVQDEKTRLNFLFRKLSNEFYENSKNGKYLNLDNDSYEEDNFYEADNNMFAIERITNQVVLKLVVDGPNMRLITLAGKQCKVSVNELRNYLTTMIDDSRKNDIREIIESLLYLFIYDSQNSIQDVGSNKFLLYCIEVYKKSNTTDENILKIKKILDSWLEELGTYKKTQRVATINDFRRALYTFFVMSIMYTQ